MARPTKQGIDYFPLDVDFDLDDKFQLVMAKHGAIGKLGCNYRIMQNLQRGIFLLLE